MQPINDNDGIYNYQIFREVDGQVGESQVRLNHYMLCPWFIQIVGYQNFRCGCTARNGNGDVTNKKNKGALTNIVIQLRMMGND